MIALMALLAMLVSASPTQSKVPANFWGVSLTSPQLSNRDLNRMASGRVGEAHWTFFWPGIEAVQGKFNWTVADNLVGDLASKGVGVMPVVYGSAKYAASSPQKPPLGSASARAAWQDFLTHLVDRYGPGGDYWTDPSLYPTQHPGGPIMPIRAWQVWNEPNLFPYFRTKSRVSKYVSLLRISHAAIKGADPNAKVVLAGMPAYSNVRSWPFLDKLYRHGAKRYFDIAAIHPYAPSVHFQALALRRTRRVMKSHGDGRTPLWITELGWGSGHPDKFGLNHGPQGQKRLLTKSFRMVSHNRRRWNLGRLFWFQWRDLPRSTPKGYCSGSLCPTGGLFKSDETPKPAWRAFQRFTGALH